MGADTTARTARAGEVPGSAPRIPEPQRKKGACGTEGVRLSQQLTGRHRAHVRAGAAIDEEFTMTRSLRLGLAVLGLVLGACGSNEGSGNNGSSVGTGHAGGLSGSGASGGGAGVSGAGGTFEPAGSTTTSFEGTWVVTAEPSQLLRYADGAASPADVIELANDPEYLEIIDGTAFYLGDFISSDGEVLYVQDLRTGERAELAFSGDSALAGLVFADGSLWIGDEALDVVWRVNPATREVVGGTALENHDSDQNDGLELAASTDSVYVSSFFGVDDVLRIATASGELVAQQDGDGDGTTGVTVGEGAAWTTSRFDGTLRRYTEDDLASEQAIALEADISDMTRNVVAAFGHVWVLAGEGGNAQDIFGQEARPGVFVVDAATHQPVAHVPIEEPNGMRASASALWVASSAAAQRIDPTTRMVAQTLTPASGEVVDIAFARTGGGTGSTQGLPAVDVYSIVEPPAMICENLSPFYNHGAAPLLDAASATLTDEGATTAFDQGTCRTLHNVEGEVVAYLAYFADALEEPTKYASVMISGYAGDGTYEADLNWDTESGASDYASVSAVISNGGLHAAVTDDDTGNTLELDCPATADVSLELEPMPVPARGEVVVQNAEGTVFRFANMDCGAELLGETLSVTAPDYFISEYDNPYGFELRTNEPAEQGTLPGYVWFNYYGESFSGEVTEVVLTCGNPVTGTFQGESYSGSFTCL
jgi:hypothetical protein